MACGTTRWGVIAGRGDYPIILSRRIIASGQDVVVVRITGQVALRTSFGSCRVVEAPLGAMRRAVRMLREEGVKRAFFAGGIDLSLRAVLSSRPDSSLLAALLGAWRGGLHLGDDTLLRSIAREMERLGVTIEDPRPFIQDLLASEGQLAGPVLDADAGADLALAARAAWDVGKEDRGQCVLAHRGAVVAVEGRKGTDALMRRSPGKHAVLAKVVKPGQDLRFDRPTIGPETITTAAACNIRVIGVEAAGVMILKPSRVAALCSAHGVSLVGVSPNTLS